MSVTAVIPVYNRAHSIGRAIRSILAQTQPVDEILVVDDGSTDDLAASLAPFGDRVRVIRQPVNQGAPATRNRGIHEAAGTFIAFLDSDDVWFPDKIARQSAFMRERRLAASCTNFERVAEGEDDCLAQVAFRPYGEVLTPTDVLWGCYTSPGSTFMCRRDLLIDIGGYDAAFRRFEDWDLFIRIVTVADKPVGFLAQPLSRLFIAKNYSTDQAEAGLRMLEDKHARRVEAELGLGRCFKAAIFFHQAAIAWAGGQRLRTLAYVLRTFLTHPRNHWAIRVILWGRLRLLR